MKKISAALLAALLIVPLVSRAQLVQSFEDIKLWTGSGTNRAALILQWNDGGTPTSLAWGYRWSGQATGLQMLLTIAGTTVVREPQGGDVIQTLSGADPRLSLFIERYGFGDSVYSLVLRANHGERSAADWAAGYWQYYLHGGSFGYFTYNWETQSYEGPLSYDVDGSLSYSSVSWFESELGASDRVLVDGSWDAWSFAPDFAGQSPQQPNAATLPLPEITLHLSAGGPVVSFISVAGLSYQLMFTDDLGDPFSGIGERLMGDGKLVEFTDVTPELPSHRFYRISVSQ